MKLILVILSISELLACGQNYTFSNFAGGFNSLTDVAVDIAGNVYVADYNNNQIRKIDTGGNVTTLAGSGTAGSADGTGTAAEFSNPVAVAVDTNGNVFVSDRGNHTIRKITSGGVVTTIAGNVGVPGGDDGDGLNATFKYTHGVSVDSAGNVFVADREGPTIRKLTPVGTNYVVSTIAGLFGTSGYADGTNSDAHFSNDSPSGVPVDSAGNVYVMDRGGRVIRKITQIGPDWVTTTIAGSPGLAGSADGTGSAARFNSPYNGTVDSAGNIYVADEGTGSSYGQTIRKITPVGTNWVVTTIAGSPGLVGTAVGAAAATRFGSDSPFGVTVDSAFNLYVADYGNNRVVKGTRPPTPLTIISIRFVGGNVQIDFTSAASDTTNLFTLQSSTPVGGSYGDVSPPATITQTGAGSFRAVAAPNGGTRFYRIRK